MGGLMMGVVVGGLMMGGGSGWVDDEGWYWVG